jgi:hypothetical protein
VSFCFSFFAQFLDSLSFAPDHLLSFHSFSVDPSFVDFDVDPWEHIEVFGDHLICFALLFCLNKYIFHWTLNAIREHF